MDSHIEALLMTIANQARDKKIGMRTALEMTESTLSEWLDPVSDETRAREYLRLGNVWEARYRPLDVPSFRASHVRLERLYGRQHINARLTRLGIGDSSDLRFSCAGLINRVFDLVLECATEKGVRVLCTIKKQPEGRNPVLTITRVA